MSGGISGSYISLAAQIKDNSLTEAKLASESCSAAKMKKEGISGQVLTSNGAGAVPSYQAAGGGSFNGWAWVETVVVSGADTNVLDTATAFSGNTAGALMFLVKLVGGATGGSTSLRFNGSAGAGSQQSFRVENTTVTAYKNSTLQIDPATATNDTQELIITLPNIATGLYRSGYFTKNNQGSTASSIENGWFNISTPNTATDLTSFGITNSSATGFKAGTQIMVFKRA